MNNPLSFCTRYDNYGNLIDLLYGEYIWNVENDPVSIYRRSEGKWKKIFSFPDHTIQHIHNIVYDKYRNCYFIMTGDKNDESGIWTADYQFENVKPLVKGNQKYRACVLFPTSNGIFYATDTPLEQNYVYKIDNHSIVTEVCKIPGPCIFGRKCGSSFYFSTSVEGDPRLGKWKYRFSNKLGKGVADRYSHIFRISQEGVVDELAKIKKDFLPMWFFEFGNIKFPLTEDNNIYICPQSLKAKNGTYILSE